MDNKLFLRRFHSIKRWEEEILLDVSVAFQALLLFWWSLAKVANEMFLQNYGLELFIGSKQDFSVLFVIWEVDADKLNFVGWVHSSDAIGTNIGERKKTSWDRKSRGVVKRSVNSVFTIHDDLMMIDPFTNIFPSFVPVTPCKRSITSTASVNFDIFEINNTY